MSTLQEQEKESQGGAFQVRYDSRSTSLFKFIGTATIVLTIIFNILFPKGGFTMGGVPITWGYIMLGVSSGMWLFYRGVSHQPLISGRHLRAFLFTVPFFVYICLSFLLSGVGNGGKSIALLTNSFILPAIFLLLLGTFFNDKKYHPLIYRTLSFAVISAAIYGIILFLYYWKTKSLFQIPFLTSNGTQDVDLGSKHNARGELLKLISTYNNGNIYGACTLMLFPLYIYVNKSVPKKMIMRLALLFTLSRTVWIGLVVFEFGSIFIGSKNYLKKLLVLIATMMGGAAGILVLTQFMNRGANWLVDSNLGGRAEILDQATDTDTIAWFTHTPFSGIAEIVYASILYTLGIVGLLLFLVCQGGPVLVGLTRNFMGIFNDDRRKALVLGLGIYWILAASDGAYLYIPTMAFYWFLVTLLCSHWETAD